MNQSPFNDAIDLINKNKELVHEGMKNADEVKEGYVTEEEIENDPSLKLYDAISEASIEILQNPTVVNMFNELENKAGPELTKSVIEAMVLSMTHSAHSAIVIYDELLKVELQKQFESYEETMIEMAAIVNAHSGALEEFKTRIENLNK